MSKSPSAREYYNGRPTPRERRRNAFMMALIVVAIISVVIVGAAGVDDLLMTHMLPK